MLSPNYNTEAILNKTAADIISGLLEKKDTTITINENYTALTLKAGIRNSAGEGSVIFGSDSRVIMPKGGNLDLL